MENTERNRQLEEANKRILREAEEISQMYLERIYEEKFILTIA